jgi:hypothetical protein
MPSRLQTLTREYIADVLSLRPHTNLYLPKPRAGKPAERAIFLERSKEKYAIFVHGSPQRSTTPDFFQPEFEEAKSKGYCVTNLFLKGYFPSGFIGPHIQVRVLSSFDREKLYALSNLESFALTMGPLQVFDFESQTIDIFQTKAVMGVISVPNRLNVRELTLNKTLAHFDVKRRIDTLEAVFVEAEEIKIENKVPQNFDPIRFPTSDRIIPDYIPIPERLQQLRALIEDGAEVDLTPDEALALQKHGVIDPNF